MTDSLKPFLCNSMDPARLRVSWEKWKRAFQIYASAEKITDKKVLKNKLLHLGGLELQDVFFANPVEDDEDAEKLNHTKWQLSV